MYGQDMAKYDPAMDRVVRYLHDIHKTCKCQILNGIMALEKKWT